MNGIGLPKELIHLTGLKADDNPAEELVPYNLIKLHRSNKKKLGLVENQVVLLLWVCK
jgi:hypothetical protein